MIHLLAIDIDGTLLDSEGRVPHANAEAIARASAAGIEIALATGRRYDFARQVFEPLQGPLTLILSNGAVIKTRDGTTVVKHLLPRDVALSVLARVPDRRDGTAITFDRPREGQVVFEAIDWDHPRHHRFFEANRPFVAAVSPLEACLTEDPVQLMFSGGCDEMRVIFETLRGDPAYSATLTEYLHRDFSLVDIIRAGCSKGAALAEWAGQRGLRREQVMAIGDNMNDLDMLEFAGTAVVMGNGCEELKSRGWSVTATNDECGLARALETFVLRKAS